MSDIAGMGHGDGLNRANTRVVGYLADSSSRSRQPRAREPANRPCLKHHQSQKEL